MRKTLLGLFLLVAVGFGAWRFLAPAPVSKNPMDRMKTSSPIDNVRVAKPIASAPVIRSAPEAPSQITAKRAQMEERFVDLKEEGRRMREALMSSDPKAGLAYQSLSQRSDYRELLDRRHKIEAAWAAAPEGDRDGMLNEMNRLRQQGVGLILAEIQRIHSLPPALPADTTPATPATSAPPAPTAPVVFQ
jgi:hypothetical protein